MSDEDDEPILIACGECSNRMQTSFGRLRETATLSCPACGHEMARAPEFSATLGVNYTIPEVFGGDLEASANVKYTDSYVLNNPSLFGPLAGAAADVQRYRQSAYTLVNAALNWTDPSDKYLVGVWANNLTDEDYQLSRNGSTFGDYGVWASPRTSSISRVR